MAWTSPMTFVADSVLTASQLNTHLRDNLLETSPAKASDTQLGSYFVGTGQNQIAERKVLRSVNAAQATTTSTSYTSTLSGSSIGPSVTGEVGTSAMVFFDCEMTNSSASGQCWVSIASTGEVSGESQDRHALTSTGTGVFQMGYNLLFINLAPGQQTFTMQFKVTAGTGTFDNRRLYVFPL